MYLRKLVEKAQGILIQDDKGGDGGMDRTAKRYLYNTQGLDHVKYYLNNTEISKYFTSQSTSNYEIKLIKLALKMAYYKLSDQSKYFNN